MHDLTKFQLPNSLLLGAELRRLGVGAHSLEQVAQRTTELLYGATSATRPAAVPPACSRAATRRTRLARCHRICSRPPGRPFPVSSRRQIPAA